VALQTVPCQVKTFKKISSAFGGNVTEWNFSDLECPVAGLYVQ